MKHTPGPWIIDEDELSIISSGNQDLKFIVDVPADYDKTNVVGIKQRKANAQLIAAAPEMLEALESVVSHFKETGMSIEERELNNNICDLIKKAKGTKVF